MPEVAQEIGRLADPRQVALDRPGIGRELLAQTNRHRVLEVGAPGLHDVVELPALGGERVAQATERRFQAGHQIQRAQPDRRRDHVVRGLRHVDVVVRMDGLVLPAFAAQQFVGAVREHLVAIHVVGRAGAGLIDVDHELVVVLAGQYLVGGGHDRVGQLRVEAAGFLVRQRRRLLDPHHRPHEFAQRLQPADREVLEGTLGLNAIIRIGRHVEWAEGILFGTSRGSHERNRRRRRVRIRPNETSVRKPRAGRARR